MLLQIKEADIGDIKLVASLFDAYQVFYNQTSDIDAATNFLYERISKNDINHFYCFH